MSAWKLCGRRKTVKERGKGSLVGGEGREGERKAIMSGWGR